MNEDSAFSALPVTARLTSSKVCLAWAKSPAPTWSLPIPLSRAGNCCCSPAGNWRNRVSKARTVLRLLLAADAQAVARTQLAALHSHRGQELLDLDRQGANLVQAGQVLAAQALPFGLQVEHGLMRGHGRGLGLNDNRFDPAHLLEETIELIAHDCEGPVEPDKPLDLGSGELSQSIKEQPVGQLLIGFHFPAEEIGKGHCQQGRPRGGRCAEQARQVRIVRFQQAGNTGHGLVGSLDHSLGVGVTLKGRNVAGNHCRTQLRLVQPSALAQPGQFFQAILAELGRGALHRQRTALEKELHLLAEAALLAAAKDAFEPVEQAVAGQCDGQGLPGFVLGRSRARGRVWL